MKNRPVKTIAILSLLLAFSFTTGCSKLGSNYPKCDDEDVKKLVFEILAENTCPPSKGTDSLYNVLDFAQYSLSAFAYTEKNKDLKKSSCKATLTYTVPGNPMINLPSNSSWGNKVVNDYQHTETRTQVIEYSAQYTEDGQLYVEVSTDSIPSTYYDKDAIDQIIAERQSH